MNAGALAYRAARHAERKRQRVEDLLERVELLIEDALDFDGETQRFERLKTRALGLRRRIIASATLLAATALLLLAAPADSYEYRAVAAAPCHSSYERWEERETHGGDKVMARHSDPESALQELTVRWNSGAVERVLVMPVPGRGYCVVASRYLGHQLPAGAPR